MKEFNRFGTLDPEEGDSLSVTTPLSTPVEEGRPLEVPSYPGKVRSGNSRRGWLKSTLTAGAGLAAFSFPATSEAQTTPSSVPPPLAHASQTPKPDSVTPGTTYISFSGLDFRPAASAATFDWASTNYCGIYPLSSATLYTTKLFLPERAKITELEFYVKHNIAGTDVYYLIGTSATGGSGGAIASATLSTVNSGIQTVPLSGSLPWIVDNSSTGFYLGWIPGNTGLNEILYGARIGYTGGIGRFQAN